MPNKDTLSTIAPLRSTREYLAWAIDVESELRKEGLWTVVSAGPPPVATTGSASSGPTGSSGSVSVSIPLRDTFEERDSRALGLIRTHLARRLVTKYASYSSSKGLWDALKKDFSTDNKVELAFHTLNALHSIKLHLPADTTNVTFSAMEKHVETVANLINELDNLGFGLDADLQPLYLLRSLPRSGRFDTLQASILGSVPSGTKLTLDDVEKKLLAQAESDTGDPASDTETDTAAVARTTRPSAATAPNITSPNRYCHFHKSNTHNTDDCKVLKEAVKQGKGKGKGKAKMEKANSAKDSDTDDDATAHVASVSSKIYRQVSAYIVRDSEGAYAIIIDSGASCTMTCDPQFFESASIRPLSPPRRVRLGDNSTCDAVAIGTMRLSCKTRHGMVDLTIKDALLVPNFAVTLVSVHQLASKKLSSHFTGDTCIVRNDKTKEIVLEATRKNGLYHISCKPLGSDERALYVADINDVHRKLGHTNFQSIRDMVRHGRLDGITSLTGMPEFCEACILGKMKKQPFPRSRTVP
jgi:hypothetical protein